MQNAHHISTICIASLQCTVITNIYQVRTCSAKRWQGKYSQNRYTRVVG